MLGGHDPFEQKKGGPKRTAQKAIVELLCDTKTGLETGDDKAEERLARRADSDDDGDKDDKDDKADNGAALQFVSYEREPARGDEADVLRLKWLTKYACEDEASKPKDDVAHWGFFTWIILIGFLGVSAYVIFGSWLNYNRFGARGFDMVPHSDTIRDIPYIVKDAMRRIQGGSSSRGGYSAV
jgi:hypothetical protein